LGTRDDGEIALNSEGLLMPKHPKTDAELIDDIRGAGYMIDHDWNRAISLSGTVDLEGLTKIESHANALAIYCKLLRQRLEAQQTTLTEGE
jgi:hypothetical protein